jgi:hypothetical protein
MPAKPRTFKRSGLHKLECRDCAAYVYATVAQLEAHGMPVCPCGAAYVPDELELAFLLGLYDAPVVAEFEQRTHRSELAQQRRIGWMEAQRRHAAGTLNPMSVKAADEMRAERRARARSNRLSAIMPKPEPLPF